jgi:hypothetical protein
MICPCAFETGTADIVMNAAAPAAVQFLHPPILFPDPALLK